ncbi:YheC/YheD family protein [Cytobacillus sp. Sa5YUA1]|uniref:YheC/YheD family protein n=1 Tax=Cytobacillus stercorigallinarum TaxID=2762240 RepID=A0ABR8QRA4_9BACI|nr:YheC/YheD family protein [Cytobacillus stercorigallinarum]MBD7937949.1 YheC/YheD family protein [Cytobacillus stercorigallinarum]
MKTLGIMTLYETSERTYITAIASQAKHHGYQCFRFIPKNILPHNNEVNGERFNEETELWESAIFPLPELLYDRCFYQEDDHSKKCKVITNWLKNSGKTQFLGQGLPNKLEIYDALKHSRLAPYLLHSDSFTSAKSFIKQLKKQAPLVLKPVNGSQGIGIYVISIEGDSVIIKTDKGSKQIKQTLPIHKAMVWLERLTKRYQYLIQPFLLLVDQQNRPFDLRVFLQKDAYGEWKERARAMRTGHENGIISNLSAGGTTSPYERWLDSIPKSQKSFLQEELKEILFILPSIMESCFSTLFELGIDIGIDQEGGIWILDINSKPGRKLVLQTNPQLADVLYTSPFKYGDYLLSQQALTERK